MKKKHKEMVKEGVNKLLEAAIMSDTKEFEVTTHSTWIIGGIKGAGNIRVTFKYENDLLEGK